MQPHILRSTRPFWVAFVALVLSLTATAVHADPKFPSLAGHRVIDQANILSDTTEADLELKLKGLEETTTDQFVVVTVDSLQGYEIEEYGYKLGRAWGIGQKGDVKASNGQTYKDNGLILLIAPNERKVRIEVGYGLEPVMTDAMSSIIIQNGILPRFKAGDYDGGVVAGADAIIQQLSIDRGVAIERAQAAAQAQPAREKGLPIGVIIFIIIIFVLFSRGWLPWFLLGNILGSGGNGGWGGGGGGWSGGGGGGFSGGGGSFGGGGSSGSW